MSDTIKWLLWPDTHFPKHDKRKVTIMMKVLKAWKPDHLTFLGDLDDMESPSRFAEGTPDEWRQRVSITGVHTRDFLTEVRELLPDTRIDYFEGNHETRLRQYVSKKAPALDGLVTAERVFDLDNLGITYIPYQTPPTKLHGDFHVHHGSSVSKYSAQSAKAELENYGVSGFSGHTHRMSAYHLTHLHKQLSWYECGHLSDAKQQTYSTVHNWQQGFALAYVDGNKVFPSLVPFVGNKCVVDGVVFE